MSMPLEILTWPAAPLNKQLCASRLPDAKADKYQRAVSINVAANPEIDDKLDISVSTARLRQRPVMQLGEPRHA